MLPASISSELLLACGFRPLDWTSVQGPGQQHPGEGAGRAASSLLGPGPDLACKSWQGGLCDRRQTSAWMVPGRARSGVLSLEPGHFGGGPRAVLHRFSPVPPLAQESLNLGPAMQAQGAPWQ